jgi:hypothetical protein
MPTLWQVLGYDDLAERIAAKLHEDDRDICLVEGPPGVGKSWLARDIGTLWEAQGGSTVLAEGDMLKSETPLYPFGFAMGPLPSGWTAVRPAVMTAARVAETLVGTGGLITTTVEAGAEARKTRRRERVGFLSPTEQEIVFKLDRLAKKPLLLVVDNLHWWDSESLAFLCFLNDPRTWEALPFLRNLRILAVQTPEPYQTIASPQAHEALLSLNAGSSIELGRIPQEGFEDVLAALADIPPPSRELAGEIHRLSGGHLAFAKRCADRIASGEEEIIFQASDANDFLDRLLTDRIWSLGELGKQAVSLLKVAAILGLNFRRDEVACATGAGITEAQRLLGHCQNEGVLEAAEEHEQFVHDLYRQHFLKLRPDDKRAIHQTLANCLRKLKPADYPRRCLNALEAGNLDEAQPLAVLAALQKEREGGLWRDLPPRILEVLEEKRSALALEHLKSAHDHLRRYEFSACLDALDRLPHNLHESLQAESAYIEAMCLMSTRSEVDRALGREVLENWRGYWEVEPELGFRLMRLLLYGLTHMVDKTKGLELFGEIGQLLRARVAYDPSAEDALYSIDRCSTGLFPPNISLGKKRKAVVYFGPKEEDSVLRRPVEYYRCLVNYCGGLISNSRYAEARDVYGEIEALVDEYAPDTFPRLDFFRTNGVLADYRLDTIDAIEAADRQHEIVASLEAASDPFYPANALGAYLALAGRLEDSIDTYDRLWGELVQHRADPEPNVVYMIGANRCAARFLSGASEQARAEWGELDEMVVRIPHPFRPTLVRRHERLAAVLSETDGRLLTPRAFDEILLEGEAGVPDSIWENLGRGFRTPGVEIWREN